MPATLQYIILFYHIRRLNNTPERENSVQKSGKKSAELYEKAPIQRF